MKLREALARYANRDMNVTDFEDWLVGNLQRILDSNDQAAIDLAHDLDDRLIRLSEDLLTEGEFFDAAVTLYRKSETESMPAFGKIVELNGLIVVVTNVSGSATVQVTPPTAAAHPVWVPAATAV